MFMLTDPPPAEAPIASWACWYASEGWPIFPCTGKKPLTATGFYEASCDPAQIAAWWGRWPEANIGVAQGAWGWTLDVDPRSGGDATLFALEQRYGALPPTLLAHTGDGGLHYYWTMPAEGLVNKADLGEGLDIQGQGSYAILPPSVHPVTGRRYLWDVDHGLDVHGGPQDAPPWLTHLVQQPRAARDAPLAGAPILQGTRETTLMHYAGSLRRAGLTEQELRAALEAINQRCMPPLEARDLARLAHSAVRYPPDPMLLVQSAQPGAEAAPSGPAPATHPGLDFSQGVSAQDLLKLLITPPRFLVRHLVPDGLTIFAAPAKSYKSYFSLSLALATLGVGHWCDAFPVEETGNVVFFGLEAPLSQLRNRLAQLAPGFRPQDSPHTLTFFSGMRALPTFRQGLQSAIEQTIEHYQPRLIVVDPLSYLYRLGRQDDLASMTLDLLWPLAELASQAGVALFADEHLRKRSKDDVSVVDALAGSHIKAAVVHALLVAQRRGEDITIETTLRDAPSQELTLTLVFDEAAHRVYWQYKGSLASHGQGQQDSIATRVREYVLAQKRPITVTDTIAELDLPDTPLLRANLRKIYSRLEHAGDIVRTKHGAYLRVEQD